MLVPRFIELNCYFEEASAEYEQHIYATRSLSHALIINYQRYDVLNAVCLESREVCQESLLGPNKLANIGVSDAPYG